MRFWVGTTDNDWFDHLSKHVPPVDEVNFWQPSGKPLFKHMPEGTPFLFKLKAPLNCIAGGGYYVRNSALPLSLAWATFEQKNGTASRFEFERRLRRLHRLAEARDPSILCNVLAQPFFWPREQWIHDPVGWSPNIVRGKAYDTAETEGAALWQQVESRIQGRTLPAMSDLVAAETDDGPRYGAPTVHRPRLGQGAFRVSVTEAYQRRCAMTGENTLLVLEAAHIKPYAEDGPHAVSNGLLLRSDFHKLFDAGLVTVTPELTVEVSPQIKEQYFNGKAYYRLHGQRLSVVPEQADMRPDPALLRWHNEKKFVG
jgi:putative restriction endonuclease